MKNQRNQIAARIRALREATDLALDETARRSDVSVEQYQRYEAGEDDIPVSYLTRLAELYRVDVTALLTGAEAHGHVFHVTRKGQGPVIARRKHYHYEGLSSGFSDARMQAFMVTVESHSDETPHLNAHSGQEFNHVLDGRIRLTIHGQSLILETGDSIYFDATQPHGMQALDGRPARFLAVITV